MRRYILTLIVLVFALSVSAYAAPEMPETRMGVANRGDLFVITPEHKLVGWGDDEVGILRMENGYAKEEPFFEYARRRTVLEDAVSVEGTYGGLFVIKEDGNLYGYGSDFRGAYCGKTPRDYNRFYYQYNHGTLYPIKVMDDVVMVSAGFDTFTALKKDGSVWAWGANDYGQLGQGYRSIDWNEYSLPVKVMDNCKYVVGCYAVTKDGDLYGWGASSGVGYEGMGYESEILHNAVYMPDYIYPGLKGLECKIFWGGYDMDRCSTVYAPNYICSGVNALSAGLLHMENGDVRRFEVNYRRHQSELENITISEPIAHNVRRLCCMGYLTEDNVLWVPASEIGSKEFVPALENVDYAFCWPSCCIAITLDGGVYASKRYSNEYDKLEYLGDLDSMAPERDYPYNFWPDLLRIKDIVWPVIRVLPMML
ncbi:MAG: hypothetical protein ACOX81_10005 [Candidatus Heteroscillospira sp.]|jgi:hypothetical protein